MDLDGMQALFHAVAEDVEGSDGAWQFDIQGVRVACLTDSRFDRMRLIAPIADASELTDEQRDACLEANFHTALDARYATSDGVIYAAFLHPLGSLTKEDLHSALGQVVSLVLTFGDTYSGGTLVFGVPPGGGATMN